MKPNDADAVNLSRFNSILPLNQELYIVVAYERYKTFRKTCQ